MKKNVCIILMLAGQFFCFAQEASLGITGGYTTNGFGLQAGYYKALSDKAELQVLLYASEAENTQSNIDIPYNDISLNVGYFYKLLQNRYNRFHLALGGGGLVGYEILNRGSNELETGAIIDGESQVVYGAFVGAEFAYYISDSFGIIAVANEFYHINSDIGASFFYGGIGIKYTLF